MLQLVKIDFLLIVVALLVSLIAIIERRESSRFSLFLLLSHLTLFYAIRLFKIVKLNPVESLILSNVSMLIELTFYFTILHFLIQNVKRKTYLKVFFLIYLVYAIVNALFIQPLDNGYSNYSFVLGSVFILICILFYFIEQLEGDGYRTVFKNFWVWYAAALFIFLATEIPIMSLLNHLLQTQRSDHGFKKA